jgi:hypothetical protein
MLAMPVVEPVFGHLKNNYCMAHCFFNQAVGTGVTPDFAAAVQERQRAVHGFSFYPYF